MTPKEVDELLKTCLANVTSESGAEFIESLYKQWQERHWLSDKQLAALKRWHDNL